MSAEARKRHGKKPLARGAVRVLGYHGGATGRLFRVAFDALAETFSLTTPFLKLEASRAAAAWVRWVAAQRALAAAQRERAHGKGRRPGAREIERLARRAGLEDTSYSAAVARLEQLAAKNGHGEQDLEAYLRSRYPAAASDGHGAVAEREVQR
jgi:hypothetical protein